MTIIHPEVHDYGNDSRSQDACWKDFLKYVAKTQGWIVVSAMWEDRCFSIFKCKDEAECKKEYLDLRDESSETGGDDYVFLDGKPMRIIKTIRFVPEPMEVDKLV